MCYKYASGTILVIDIFAICKYFKTIFMSASTNNKKIEIKGVSKSKIVYKLV